MSATIIDGQAIGKQIREELRERVARLRERGITPGLTVVIVGEDPASQVYVRMKGKAADELGMKSETIRLSAATPESELMALVDRLNADPTVHGILVQSPLPKPLNFDRVIRRLDPDKDVDGFHPVNVGKYVIGDQTAFKPCTPWGVVELLRRSGIDPRGLHAVVVGRSMIVGRPVANLLLQDVPGGNATVTICHTKTRDLASVTRQAEILVVAAGRPEVITGDMIRPGAVVIDVGVNRVDDPSSEKGYRLTGDVKFSEAKEVASAITPVPGGVGPMTIAMLMTNTVVAAERAAAAA
ncbi:MAG TPA: bifunctional methylenetetrahydrofolate dehydrogenase/methenyltetrahydrofolate cyclohydrolase FolD [Gemmatimonadales bacterium]|nr:bifunctional methylenetetrahydrofolate dehydrogenase/methenyltetrahydrofolate cyclohydrolase FolD [Gemmatimonadales bacterium]